jgi:hypothetical protein
MVDAHHICQRIIERLKKSNKHNMTISIGIATAGDDHFTII